MVANNISRTPCLAFSQIFQFNKKCWKIATFRTTAVESIFSMIGSSARFVGLNTSPLQAASISTWFERNIHVFDLVLFFCHVTGCKSERKYTEKDRDEGAWTGSQGHIWGPGSPWTNWKEEMWLDVCPLSMKSKTVDYKNSMKIPWEYGSQSCTPATTRSFWAVRTQTLQP